MIEIQMEEGGKVVGSYLLPSVPHKGDILENDSTWYEVLLVIFSIDLINRSKIVIQVQKVY